MFVMFPFLICNYVAYIINHIQIYIYIALTEDDWTLTQKELLTTVEKLTVAEEAAEGVFTCMHCMDLYEEAVTCIPCSHISCKKCAYNNGSSTEPVCRECGPDTKVLLAIENHLLNELASKHTFKKTALNSLKHSVRRLKFGHKPAGAM